MVKKKKISRKQFLKEPDEFLTFSRKIFELTLDNQNYVFGTIGAIIIIILIFTGFSYLSHKKELKASELFAKAISQYHKLNIDNSEKSQTENQLQDNQENIQEIFKKLDELASNYTGTSAGKISLISFANICFEKQNYQKAIELYKKAEKLFNDDSSLIPIVNYGLAYSYAQLKEYDKAISYFEKLITTNSLSEDSVLFQLGLLYEITGNDNKKTESFNKIISDYKNSSFYEIVKSKMNNS